MTYEERIVCFLDILGFRSHLAGTTSADGKDVPDKIQAIAKAIEIIRDVGDADRPDERPDTQVTQFSDSLVVSFPARTNSGVFFALLGIMWIQMRLVQHGMLCRGGIAQGKLIHTARLIFGPAFVEAYNLETRVAIYPRVILSEAIVRAGIAAHAPHHLPKHESESIHDLISLDADGMYFVDYITKGQSELDDPETDYPGYLGRLCDIVIAGRDAKDPAISTKFEWIRGRLTPHVSLVKRNASKHLNDPDLVAAYEAIPDP